MDKKYNIQWSSSMINEKNLWFCNVLSCYVKSWPFLKILPSQCKRACGGPGKMPWKNCKITKFSRII